MNAFISADERPLPRHCSQAQRNRRSVGSPDRCASNRVEVAAAVEEEERVAAPLLGAATLGGGKLSGW
jgi:hypothetical protein